MLSRRTTAQEFALWDEENHFTFQTYVLDSKTWAHVTIPIPLVKAYFLNIEFIINFGVYETT